MIECPNCEKIEKNIKTLTCDNCGTVFCHECSHWEHNVNTNNFDTYCPSCNQYHSK